MILVLLGTQDKPFDRLLKEVDKLKKEGIIRDKVVAQIGSTKGIYDHLEVFDFCSKEKIESLIDEARIIISHAGVGTITECIEKDKKVIVVPRVKKHGEHTNDHQLQITKEFALKKYILPLYDVKKLQRALSDIKTFEPEKYESNTNNFSNKIKEYIDML